MGEIADMMLDGTLCEGCGEYIGTDNGFPSYCSQECAKNRGQDYIECDYDDDDDEDETPAELFDSAHEFLDQALIALHVAIDDLKKMNRRKKARSLASLHKQLTIFKESII